MFNKPTGLSTYEKFHEPGLYPSNTRTYETEPEFSIGLRSGFSQVLSRSNTTFVQTFIKPDPARF
jgi:hypothetical protein